jgi:hypothetical protein
MEGLDLLTAGGTTTPGIGTPGAWNHGGNSAPAQAPVAGLGKSEQSGERRGAK